MCPERYNQIRQRDEEMKEIQDRLFEEAQREMQMRMARKQQQNVQQNIQRTSTIPTCNEAWLRFWSEWNAAQGDPFQCLGLPGPIGITLKDLKSRYRNLSKLVHPDKCKHELASSAQANITNAYHKAVDHIKKVRSDRV